MIWVREAYGEAKGETKLRPKSRDMRMLREFHVVLDSGKEKKQSKTKYKALCSMRTQTTKWQWADHGLVYHFLNDADPSR